MSNRNCRFCPPSCEACPGDRTCSCHELVDGHGAIEQPTPGPSKQLGMVRGLLDAYGEVEGTPTDYEFLVSQLRAAVGESA